MRQTAASTARDAEVLRLYETGHTVQTLSAALGLAPARTHQLLQRARHTRDHHHPQSECQWCARDVVNTNH